MREEYIREYPSQRIIGILRYDFNGDIYAVDFSTRMILGFYRASTDETLDYNTRLVVSKGNTVVSFIYKK